MTANAIVLGYPSKMPGTSYGLPAGSACPVGSKLMKIKGSTCAGCYALKGNYKYSNVRKSQETRLKDIFTPDWVERMVVALKKAHRAKRPAKARWTKTWAPGWHRWHDSGDLQSVEHLIKIIEVAEQTPEIRHWLPTRETQIVLAAHRRLSAFCIGFPDNLTIRLSSTMVDGPAPKAWALTSTVVSDGATCPAPAQGNACMDCRKCWSQEAENVAYHKH